MFRIFFRTEGKPSPDVVEEEEQEIARRESKLESSFREPSYKKDAKF